MQLQRVWPSCLQSRGLHPAHLESWAPGGSKDPHPLPFWVSVWPHRAPAVLGRLTARALQAAGTIAKEADSRDRSAGTGGLGPYSAQWTLCIETFSPLSWWLILTLGLGRKNAHTCRDEVGMGGLGSTLSPVSRLQAAQREADRQWGTDPWARTRESVPAPLEQEPPGQNKVDLSHSYQRPLLPKSYHLSYPLTVLRGSVA